MSNTLSETELADSLIPRRDAFRKLGFSVAQGLRVEKFDPSFPKAVAVVGRNGGTRGFFRASELAAWMRSLPQWRMDEAVRERNRRAVSNTAHVVKARGAEEPA